MALTAADIAYWPAKPRMKSVWPAIAERLDNPDVLNSMLRNKSNLMFSLGVTQNEHS